MSGGCCRGRDHHDQRLPAVSAYRVAAPDRQHFVRDDARVHSLPTPVAGLELRSAQLAYGVVVFAGTPASTRHFRSKGEHLPQNVSHHEYRVGTTRGNRHPATPAGRPGGCGRSATSAAGTAGQMPMNTHGAARRQTRPSSTPLAPSVNSLSIHSRSADMSATGVPYRASRSCSRRAYGQHAHADTSQTQAGQAARRLGVRLRSPAAMAGQAGYPGPHRSQGTRVLAAAGALSLGHRAHHVRHEALCLYPRFSREELGRRFLGPMTYLDPKGEGDKSTSENQ